MASTSSISFNFSELKDIGPALRRCAVGNRGRSVTDEHIVPLRRLAAQLESTSTALENVERLATGYEDLVVILLEPADREARMSYKEILSGRGSQYTSAVQLLDQTLRLAFNNQRNVENTIILDSRPLRSREIRGGEKEETCQQNDGLAYTALGKVLDLLRPKVIVVCHCDSAGLEAGLPEYLFSSVRDAGETSFLPMKNGHSCVKISSFHPMFFARTEISSPLRRLTREHLFDATFVIAANALAGRTVCGFGIRNLRHCALDGPCFRFTEQGVNISYQRVGPEDVASSGLVERLRQLGLLSEPRLDELDRLIESYQEEGVKQAEMGVNKQVLPLKRDPFEEFSHLIPALPRGLVSFS